MTYSSTLPVYKSKDLIIEALKDNQVIIVESPTGSGKTTQIPLILREIGFANNKTIGVTQPRRIATLSVCEFINKQIEDENLDPSYCGYKMRFWDTTTDKTRIKILTDGMLLQELKSDPLLNSYSVIMIDEAHERSLNIDLILGLLKQVILVREDFKVIISSATINTKVFSEFFTINNKLAPIISIDAKNYDVEIKYYPLKKKNDLQEICHSISQIINLNIKQLKSSNYKNTKDMLVFLPGELEIKEVYKYIFEFCDYKCLEVMPLYGRLSKEEQEKVFIKTPEKKIKVVLATNIAETSLTIDGIKIVIDSGLCRMNFYNQFNYTSSLITKEICASSAMQRSGRAGRTSNGECYRLYSEEDFLNKNLYAQEEILRTDLSEVVLRMVDLGIKDIENFNFITKPSLKSIQSAIKTLISLNAISNDRQLTNIGEIMVKFPLSPRLSRCLVQAIKTNAQLIHPVSICISFLSCKTPFVLPSGEEDAARDAHSRFSNRFGDFIAYQYLYSKYTSIKSTEEKEHFCNVNYLDFQSMEEIVHVVNQLCEIAQELGFVNVGKTTCNYDFFAPDTLKCMIPGLIQFVCSNKKGSVYKTCTADEIYIHPGSAYFRKPPKYIIAGEIVQTSKTYARTVSPLEESWIASFDKTLLEKLKSKSTDIRETTTVLKRTNKKQINICGINFNVIKSSNKKTLPIAEIPYEKLYQLIRAYRKSSRHPKKINATLIYRGYYVQYGQNLRDILDFAYRIKDIPNAQDVNTPSQVFFPDSFEKIKPYLKYLMGFKQLDKYKNRLGFLEIISSKNGVFFHVNNSFTEALNNNAYSLLTICDYVSDKEFKYTYNRIVKLLD